MARQWFGKISFQSKVLLTTSVKQGSIINYLPVQISQILTKFCYTNVNNTNSRMIEIFNNSKNVLKTESFGRILGN